MKKSVFDDINQNILKDAVTNKPIHNSLNTWTYKLISWFYCTSFHFSPVSFHRNSKSVYTDYHVNATLEFSNTAASASKEMASKHT